MQRDRDGQRQGTRRGRNRNAERSVRLLETSFLQLLAEKPYERITVTDVTTRANLNRGTFYAHFEGMDDLRDSVLEELTARLSQLIDKVMVSSFVEDPMPVLSEIGRYLTENHELLQRLVSSKTLEPFLNSVRTNLRGHIHANLAGARPESAPANLLVADYLSYGVLGAYRAWLLGDYGSWSVDELNESLCGLVRGAGASCPSAS